MNNFEIIKKEIERIFKNSDCANPYDKEKDPTHSKEVLKWVLKLKPDTDDALKISALGHDIDRAIESRRVKIENFNDYGVYKNEHAKESALIIAELLEKHNYEKPFIEKVKKIIGDHEIGGNEEIDALKEADSITFFSWDIYYYIKDKGVEGTIKKIRFMYKRLSPKAKGLVQKIKYKDNKIKEIVLDTIS